MDLTSFGAAETVTGSKSFLKTEDSYIMIDSGMFQGEDDKLNLDNIEVDFSKVDCIFVTHAHYDHCGYLPFAIKKGFRGQIFCTQQTRDLIDIVLNDSFKILLEKENLPESLMYTQPDLELAISCLKVIKLNDITKFNDFSFEFFKAGHILGAASLVIESQNKRIWFSGDLGRPDHSIHSAPKLPSNIDHLVIESTYGNRDHEDKAERSKKMSRAIKHIKETNGVLLIPSFAIARTQELVVLIHNFLQDHPDLTCPVLLDSPMAIAASNVYLKYADELNIDSDKFKEAFKRIKMIEFPKDNKLLEKKNKPYILISSSGMLTGGKVLKHFEMLAENKKNFILFTGFQAIDTLGRQLLEGADQIPFKGRTLKVQATIDKLTSLSAHADESELISFIKGIKPKNKIILNHGTQDSISSFKDDLQSQLSNEIISLKKQEPIEL